MLILRSVALFVSILLFFFLSFYFVRISTTFYLSSHYMAHPSSCLALNPDRSRSRDDPPMWTHPTPDRPRNPHHHESWNYTPLLRHTRRVLIIIDLEQVQHLMSARQSDVMQATTFNALPSLGRLEQYVHLQLLRNSSPDSDSHC